jgi:hypothetical protein
MSLSTLVRRVALMLMLGVLYPFAAHAVVQNVAIVNSSGQPVANSTVTIVFPDGTEKEGKTDRKGLLIFDFPNNGNYVIRFPGGQMSYTATGIDMAPTHASPWLIDSAAVLAVGTAVALDSSNNSNNNSDSSGTGSTGGSGGSGGGGGTGGGSVDGTYSCAFGQTSNPDMHPVATLDGNYVVTSSGTTASISHQSGGTDFTASGAISGNTASYSGSGSFEGFSGAQVTGNFNFSSSSNDGTISLVCSACPDTNGNSTPDPVQGQLSCSKI